MVCLQHKLNSTTIVPRVSTAPNVHHGVCTLKKLSPEDAVEERLLLDSIAWPETPLLPSPLSLEKTSDPAHSTFTILPPGRGGGQRHVGDQLEVRIKMYDFKGNPRTFGGDFLLAWLHNPTLGAGVVGRVVDHLNGSYSAVFSLLWEGSSEVQVTLVHTREAVRVMQNMASKQPYRVYFKSLFRSGKLSETTVCNVCLRPTPKRSLCNYTDIHTGEPWFCFKPMKLSCGARIIHTKGGMKQNVSAGDQTLFQSEVNMKVPIQASGPANITVLPKQKGQSNAKSSSVKSGPSGYYYQDTWRALDGTTVHQFNTSSAITQCLRDKVVHMYGDSTIRQWFEYLNAVLPDLKKFNLHHQKQVGPFMALDHENNILVTYRCHGPPINFASVPTSELRYIANELDGLIGGSNTVVVIGVWAHFTTYPVEVYMRRLLSIRRAVVRLLDRAPGTLVVIRTANPKTLTRTVALISSDWHAVQCDKAIRAAFKGLNVRLVDAWEMVQAHRLPHNLHPQPAIIQNMINVLLSHTCPKKGG
ncbi:NXPE family member 3-like [Pempheris klunzingeri]|uniref:NXPE family member 3-like n=1 Tax=Pempheris klunzingeri TaxID=3127111 RepID=UPI003980BCD2